MRSSVLLVTFYSFLIVIPAFAFNNHNTLFAGSSGKNVFSFQNLQYQSAISLDEYVFLVTDARDKQIIKSAIVKIKDNANEQVEAKLNQKTGEWKAMLDKTKGYFVAIEAPGYIGTEIEIDAVDAKKVVKPIDRLFSLSLKKNDDALLALSAIDAVTLETIPATFRILRPDESTLTGKSDKDTPYRIEIGPKKKFSVEINSEGYKSSTEQIAYESIRTEYPGASITMKRFPLKRDTYNFLFRIIDKETQAFIINTRMRIINMRTRQSIAARIEKDGFSANLSPDAEYSVEVESEGYTQTSQNVDLKDLIARNEFVQDILLEKKISDRYRLIVVDEETNRNVPEAILRIYNSKKEPVSLLTTNVQSEWNAELKMTETYTAEVITKGYVPYIAPLVKEGKTLYLKIARTPAKETYFIAIDFYSKSVLPASYQLTSESKPEKGIYDNEKSRYRALLGADKDYEIAINVPGYSPLKEKVNPAGIKDNLIMFELKKIGYNFTFNTLDAKTRTPVQKPKVSFVSLENDNLALLQNNKTSTLISPVDFEKKYALRVQADNYKYFTAEFNLLALAANNFTYDVLLEKIEPAPTSLAIKNNPLPEEPLMAKKEEKKEPFKEEKAQATVIIPKEPSIVQPRSLTDNYFKSIEIGKQIKLENVFFDQSQPLIKPESYPELDKLVDLLKDNPKLNIEIIGHTDNVGDPRLNLYLSELRAKAVSNYLFNKGIAQTRLMSSGRGHQQPVASNDKEETRQKNRRVEFRVMAN